MICPRCGTAGAGPDLDTFLDSGLPGDNKFNQQPRGIFGNTPVMYIEENQDGE